MTSRSEFWRLLAAIALAVTIVAAGLGGDTFADSGTSRDDASSRRQLPAARGAALLATPQAADPLDSDPLDGDRGDTPTLPAKDPEAPKGRDRLDIVRSGRPTNLPRSDVAYDDDAGTVWTPETGGGDAWLWLDLGGERRIREVRWLARGGGGIEVAISSDRERWQEVEQVVVDAGWQGVALRDDARYVRLTLLPGGDGQLPEIAEATVYGRGGDVSLEQKARKDRADKKKQRAKAEKTQTSDAGQNDNSSGKANKGKSKSKRGKRGVTTASGISAQPGETRCEGDRQRCSAREGRVDVNEDCTTDGSCVIDIQADGGTAICDATGGTKGQAGGGAGKKGGDGGRCEAVADGGTVSVGDINP
jgi:hypothetical protein